MIYIGADHRGYNLKETLKNYLKELGFEFEDLGALKLNPNDDYPDFALAVAKKVAENLPILSSTKSKMQNRGSSISRPNLKDLGEIGTNENRGILICGSGVGVDIVANKLKGVRSALCFDVNQAKASRNDDNTNVLSFPADFISESLAKEIVKIWLETPFSGLENYTRRIEKIKKIEEFLIKREG